MFACIVLCFSFIHGCFSTVINLLVLSQGHANSSHKNQQHITVNGDLLWNDATAVKVIASWNCGMPGMERGKVCYCAFFFSWPKMIIIKDHQKRELLYWW